MFALRLVGIALAVGCSPAHPDAVAGDDAGGSAGDAGDAGAGFAGAVGAEAGVEGGGVEAGVRASTAQIVYMADVKTQTLGARGSEIVVSNLDGSGRVQITDNDVLEFLPHFSPDGTRLVYTRYGAGTYGDPNAQTDVAVYDFATAKETIVTNNGKSGQPSWSPDGKRIAFWSGTGRSGGFMAAPDLWIMNADGSDAHRVGGPSGADDDQGWGDLAWSHDDWILFVVSQTVNGCFKVRTDKIRPDGTSRTKVSDGGPNCTPMNMEQSGDADPGWSADGKTIYSSRGMPRAPAGVPDAGLPDAGAGMPSVLPTERRLFAFSSDAWVEGKTETDLSLPSEPDCIEGVPKGSPDGTRILVFRTCFGGSTQGGVYVTDTKGSYRTFVAEGFGPDWNPVAK